MLLPRPLGRTGIMVSPLGLGTVKLGRNRGVKYPASFELPTDAQAADLLRAAQKHGVTLIDTAPAYGESEARLGRILGACGGRDRWTIVTKAGERFDATTQTSAFDFAPAAIIASLEQSLRLLRTDRVECLLLHSDGDDERLINESGATGALERLKKQGKTRAVGVSTKTATGAMLAVTCGRFDVAMLTLNAQATDDLPAIREAATRGVGVLVKKAFASGHGVIAGASDGGAGTSASSADAPASAAQRTEAALRLCFVEPGVSSVVVGTINPDHLRENALAAERVLSSLGRLA